MKTHADIIRLWPRIVDFSRDVGISYASAQKMVERNSIRSCYWPRVISAANRRGLATVNYELLASISAREVKRKVRQKKASAQAEVLAA